VNGVSLLGYAVPAHYGTDARNIILQVDRPADGAILDGPVTIGGWAMVEASVEWQPFRPESVAKYREPVREVAIYRGGPPGSGTMLTRAEYGLSRPDVADFYGNSSGLIRVGYQAVVQPAAIGAGTQLLYICATPLATDSVDCVERAVRVDGTAP
jgi:hypothetical protein